MESVFISIGLLGAAVVLAAYFLLSAGKLASDGYTYPLLNMIGSAGVLVSLVAQWNLASCIINAAWVVISLIGMARVRMKRVNGE